MGKIYSGIATYTASQPVEVVVLQSYKAGVNSTETGESIKRSIVIAKYLYH